MNGLAEPNDGQSGSGNIYLTPPELFAIVTEGIYRCASIEFPNVTFLKTLHLRTIVTLTPDPPPKPLQSLLTTPHPAISTSSSSASSAITTTELVHTPPLHASPEAWTTHRAQTLRALKAALHLLRKERQPVLVVDPGGLLCGIVRRWMGWNLTSVVLEYSGGTRGGWFSRSFRGSKAKYGVEEYLERVDVEALRHLVLLESLVKENGEVKEEDEEDS